MVLQEGFACPVDAGKTLMDLDLNVGFGKGIAKEQQNLYYSQTRTVLIDCSQLDLLAM